MKGKIFNAQEVKAIIAGNKTQFREVCLFQPTNELAIDALLRLYKPYGIGQKIFVKEKFARSFDNEGNPIITLEADSKQERKWKPAQHMKQEHSRLTLEITNIKVERLQDISEEDARLEGFPVNHLGNYYEPSKLDPWQGYARASFSLSWNPTHKKPEEKFYANPFVWVVDFKINK